MLDRFAASARDVVVLAQEEARALRHPAIGGDHVLLALTRDDGAVGEVLRRNGATHDELAARLPAGGAGTSGTIPFTPAAHRLLEAAQDVAEQHGHPRVTSEHLALATLEDPGATLGQELEVGRLRDEIEALLRRTRGSRDETSASSREGHGIPPEPWFRPPG